MDPNGANEFDPGRVATAGPKSSVRVPLLLMGLLLILCGAAVMFADAACEGLLLLWRQSAAHGMWVPYLLFGGLIVSISGCLLAIYDLFVLLPKKRMRGFVSFDQISNRMLTVVLTAYNDELSIGEAVRDFAGHPLGEAGNCNR